MSEKIDLLTVSENGYNYQFTPSACGTCGGHCCTGEHGYIWIKYPEIEKLAQHLALDIKDFTKQYLKKVNYRYSLTEKQIASDNFACVFFDTHKKQCSVYEARPSQCHSFPFWQYYRTHEKELRDECPGIV